MLRPRAVLEKSPAGDKEHCPPRERRDVGQNHPCAHAPGHKVDFAIATPADDAAIRSLNSRSYLDVYVVAKPRQRPQQLVKRAGRESSSKERRQICLWDLQQRSSLVDRETPTLEQPVDSSN